MGKVFKYVDDAALAAHRLVDTPCSICNALTDVFYVSADAEIPEYGYGPITEACIHCIRRFSRDQVAALDVEKRIPAYLIAFKPTLYKSEILSRQDEIIDELRRTPRLPHFLQWEDWPFCCGDIVEYMGDPSTEEAELLDREGQYWDRGPAMSQYRAETLVPSEKHAVLGGVSAFRCPRCNKRYWTFQST